MNVMVGISSILSAKCVVSELVCLAYLPSNRMPSLTDNTVCWECREITQE